MTESKICTCPSGDGSLRWPCPAHPAEQAGGDERAAFERAFTVQEGIYFDDKRGEYRSMNLRAIEATDAQDLNLRLQGWQARAALAQPSGEVVVTKNESGAIVSVTRQDKEGRVLSVIAESATLTAQAEQAEAERPEVVATMYTHHDDVDFREFVVVGNCDKGCEGFYGPEKLMTVAQHERIVGELRAVIAQLRQHKNDYMDSGQETYRALQNEIREREAEIARLDGLVSGRTAERDAALAEVERIKTISDNYYVLCVERQQQLDAALARVAEMERQEPVAWVEVIDRDYGPYNFHGKRLLPKGKHQLYAAPVAQAQHSVPGDIMRDAQRYRWLRDQQFYFSFSTENSDAGISSCTAGMSSRFKNLSWVDAAIDSAIAAAPGNSVPQAWLDVQAERRRQVEAEGWTPEHDDEHSHGQIARAAACYALAGSSAPNDGTAALLVSLAWPWDEQWWKPTSARRDLVKACALALAEIERLDRAAPGKEGV
ncbi:hypothetical protein [Pseudomonas aeruginosa]|uniref:hypothetical protein n=1 Tax=Pseudomonas aeruginosa TaxID=287 RepID=UPI0008FB12A7|nr:hypothetical protein [Pseudomonas aeruginosa]AVK02251.1 hypothetical protein CSB94_3899 [Pseudomonas aeruginosa]MCZ7743501.1 hypothetical protein [Pseudomonas aeruginosa]MCZ7775342.1 hypothetical protein [Pseudomonas aeruginosa]MCZ7788351.1 hypothetical protein [Pseudomonas aeruginosa]OKN82246.1 hypothetical protein AM471_000934 [Pseudomonas aeruginosa]